MCVVNRVDAKNQNTSFTQALGILVEDTTNAYIFWSGVNTAKFNNLGHNSEIWVRPLNKTTLALGTAFNIDANDVVGGENAWDWDGVAVCRLDSGVMIAAYGQDGLAPTIHAKESAANDHLTWGSRATVDVSGANRCLGGLGTDGTNVWALSMDQNNYSLYIHKRTAANTWAAAATALGSGKIFAAGGFVTSPWYDVVPSYRLSSMRCIAMQSATVGCIVLSYSSAANLEDTIRCLYTTDGWATTNQVTIKSYVASADSVSFGASVRLIKTSDGTLYCFWIENNAAAGHGIPKIATSSDMGATWTVVGSPTPMTPYDWDNTYDGAMAFDTLGGIYCSMFDKSDASNIKHRLFKYRGGSLLTDWTQTICEHIEQTICDGGESGGTGADAFVNAHGDFVRLFNGVETVASVATNIVAYLVEEGVVVPPVGPPPLVEEAPTGIDRPNVYLRLDIADKRGWSAHNKQGVSFAHWPEGDRTSQRRIHEVLFSESSLDPAIVNPNNMTAINRLDDPERWGKETIIDNGDGTTEYMDDPFRMRWWSAELTIGEMGSTNLVRAVYLKYRRQGHKPFPIQVWLDGILVHTKSIRASWPDPEEFWWPIPREANGGSRVQLRVEDMEPADLIVEGYSVKFRPKHWRMRNV